MQSMSYSMSWSVVSHFLFLNISFTRWWGGVGSTLESALFIHFAVNWLSFSPLAALHPAILHQYFTTLYHASLYFTMLHYTSTILHHNSPIIHHTSPIYHHTSPNRFLYSFQKHPIDQKAKIKYSISSEHRKKIFALFKKIALFKNLHTAHLFAETFSGMLSSVHKQCA